MKKMRDKMRKNEVGRMRKNEEKQNKFGEIRSRLKISFFGNFYTFVSIKMIRQLNSAFVSIIKLKHFLAKI